VGSGPDIDDIEGRIDTGGDSDDLVAPDAATIAGLLADDDRRQAFAALVLGASSIDEVRTATGLSVRAAATALERLVAGELVERTGLHDHVVLGAAFRRAARAARAASARAVTGDEATGEAGAPTDEARVLRTYLRNGRLTHIPVHRAKRLVVLDRLAQDFEIGIHFSEAQVNAILRRYHDDVAALRRYLVDEGFLDRAAGEYWRSGGSVSRGAGPGPRP
jgi:hypothetical protein